MNVKMKLEKIEEEIMRACHKSNRDPKDITIIAVTKYVSVERTQEVIECGIQHIGENRDDGLVEKWNALGDKPIWHYIGTLQTRKVKNVIDIVDYIHSVDRLALAQEINKRAKKQVKCFMQVNVSGEESKHGLQPTQVIEFVQQLGDLPHLYIIGLMTMAPNTEDEQVLRNCFRQLKDIQIEVKNLQLPYAPCKELSMGMSNDYGIAIEEGATMVRIGTALVG
jgi:pyridoxal phosphate enzyme (YggS family)